MRVCTHTHNFLCVQSTTHKLSFDEIKTTQESKPHALGGKYRNTSFSKKTAQWFIFTRDEKLGFWPERRFFFLWQKERRGRAKWNMNPTSTPPTPGAKQRQNGVEIRAFIIPGEQRGSFSGTAQVLWTQRRKTPSQRGSFSLSALRQTGGRGSLERSDGANGEEMTWSNLKERGEGTHL